MPHTLYELDVRLQEIEPAIWRTIEISGGSSLEVVHFAIQVAMGWTNSHLHQFTIGETAYGMTDVDDELELEDERKYRLQDLVGVGESFVYEYDFGDSWNHDVTVKKVTVVSTTPKPKCTGGARACPPEDCGGTGGYEELLQALADPEHQEHASSVTWSNNFKSERFSIPKAGLDLRKAMKKLEAFADGEDGEQDVEGDDLVLPKKLVEEVLALEPMQRASLGALILGSLANQLLDLRSMRDQLITAMKKPPERRGRS